MDGTMIVQRWSAKIMPMRPPTFLGHPEELNARDAAHDRVGRSRVHDELYGGHEVATERGFADVAARDADEHSSLEPDIWELEVKLLESTVPGTVSIRHHLLRDRSDDRPAEGTGV
jgi:hypothetical protein